MAKKKQTTNSPLDKLVAARFEKYQQQTHTDLGKLDLLDFLVAASPHLQRPTHLEPIVPYLIACEEGPQFFAFSAPPRHGKSILVNHFVAWMMIRHPGIRIAYGCYGLELSEFFSSEVKDILVSNGYEVDRSQNNKREWRLKNTSSFKAVAPGSGFTGRGADIIIVDDPYKSRTTAESGKERETTWNWFTSVAVTRRSPSCSVIVTHCIARGQRVLLGDGTWKPIEEVAVNDTVASLDGDECKPQRVVAQRWSGRDPIYEVKTARTAFRANAQHPVLVRHHRTKKQSWVPVEALSKQHQIAVSPGLDVAGSCGFSDDFMWLFGFMLGDGWVTVHERKSGASTNYAVCVAKSVYPELNARVTAALESELGCRPYDTDFGYVRADCNAAGRKLCELGLHRKAKEKTIPAWVFETCSTSQRRALLDGLLEADGHSPKRMPNSRVLGVASEALARGAEMLARTCGVRVSKTIGSTQTVQPPHSKAPIESTIYRANYKFEDLKIRWERFESATHVDFEDVFDLTVENTENFVVESAVVHNTRWCIGDVIDRLHKELKKPFINLEAVSLVDGEERALWPEQWPLARLREIREILGEYDWFSLYQGDPRPRGGAVFGDPTAFKREDFERLVEDGQITKWVIGIDCAYTKKTHSDYSVAVVVAIDKNKNAYVVDVRRVQVESQKFGELLREMRVEYEYPGIYWFTGGIEKTVAEHFKNTLGIPIKCETAKEDKFARAQSVAAAWNCGKVRVPEEKSVWLDKFLSEVLTFTGLDDPHDDQVDALAAAFIPNARPRVPRGMIQDPFGF